MRKYAISDIIARYAGEHASAMFLCQGMQVRCLKSCVSFVCRHKVSVFGLIRGNNPMISMQSQATKEIERGRERYREREGGRGEGGSGAREREWREAERERERERGEARARGERGYGGRAKGRAKERE